ncbi:hypothetical protein Y032_0129g1498 [Ancylostoma ceylanicum]|uniref:Uncharacterized protein n=1 Tax=Ancylostoma ceylanicum TaxID=53326 RepID=A0A016T7N5_9BILA|nr:hypothetical protein Y032_0129g1498 [Ancylostoma ceylanicum]
MSVSPLLLFVLFAYSCCQSNPGPGAPGPRNNWGGLGLQNGPPVPVTGQTSGGAGNNPWQSSNIPGPSNNWGGPGLQIGRPVPVAGGNSGSGSSWNQGRYTPYWRRRYWNPDWRNTWYGNHWNPIGVGFSRG